MQSNFSQSSIKEEMLQSRTNLIVFPNSQSTLQHIDNSHQPLHKTTLPQEKRKSSIKPSSHLEIQKQKSPPYEAIQFTENKPIEGPFVKYYEENIKLKRTQLQMEKQLAFLKHSLREKDVAQKIKLEEQLKVLAGGKKNAWDTKHQLGGNRGASGKKDHKTQHLLQIIEHYKDKMIVAQEQLSNLRRQKQILESQVQAVRGRKVDQISHPQRTVEEDFDMFEKYKKLQRELEIEKEKNKFYEISVKGLQNKLRAAQHKLDDFENLKIETRSLQDKILRLTQLPTFSDVIDRVEEQRKIKESESKYKMVNEKYNLMKDTNIKNQAEIKLLQNKLIQLTYEQEVLEKQCSTLRDRSLNNPILQKLSNNPALLIQVVSEIELKKQKGAINKSDFQDSKISNEKLILEKQDLARQLIKTQERVKYLEQMYKQKQHIYQLQKNQLKNTIGLSLGDGAKAGEKKVYCSKDGVPYDGDISMFSPESGKLGENWNYFDVYLGEVSLIQSMVQNVTNIRNTDIPLIMATVDFYNHPTEHSKLTQGCRCHLQSEFSFKIAEDQFFFKFLQKGSLQIDMWAAQGSKNFHLGKGQIELKSMVLKCKPKLGPVVSTSVAIYLGQRVMGSLNLVMRMRVPIYEKVQKMYDSSHASAIEGEQVAEVRRLVIHIEEGNNFGQKSNTFVYYPFRMEDYYTKTSKGNNPAWNHFKMLELKYDTQLKNYLRKNQIQFTIFDDSVILYDEKSSDVVGTGSISLLPLLQGKQIKQRLEIRKGNQRKGTIDVKIFWHEPQKATQEIHPEQLKNTQLMSLHQTIREFMTEHSIDADKVFRMIDNNKTGLISFDEFDMWIKKLLPQKLPSNIISIYYKSFKQPVNLQNFVAKISEKALVYESPSTDLVAQFGMINKFLKSNSIQIKKQSLSEFLEGKNLVEVVCEIDTDRNGYITKKQLQTYFEKHGIEAEVEGEKIKLFQFLKKYTR